MPQASQLTRVQQTRPPDRRQHPQIWHRRPHWSLHEAITRGQHERAIRRREALETRPYRIRCRVARSYDRKTQLNTTGLTAELLLDEPGVVQFASPKTQIGRQAQPGDTQQPSDDERDGTPIAPLPGAPRVQPHHCPKA